MPKLIIIILLVSCIHLKDDNVKEFENETNDKNTIIRVSLLSNGKVFDFAVA